MLTSSFACTSSPASDAITSLAFMFDEVPEPVWKTSIGNWSSSSPAAIRSPAAAIRSAFSSSSSPSSALTRAAAALIRPSQRATGAGIGSPETGKLSIAFLVSPPQSSRRASVGLMRSSLASRSTSAPTRAARPSSGASPADGRGGRRAPRSCSSIADQPAYSTNSTPRSASSRSSSPPDRVEQPGAGVLEQPLGRLGGVLLVRADHAARAALDPARAVEAAGRRARARRPRAPRRSGSRRAPRRTGHRGAAAPR